MAEWRRELVDRAKEWPATFLAHLSGGNWQLLGANEDVYREFGSCAECVVREMSLPLSESSPTDVLLYHLKEAGRHVSTSKRLQKHHLGSTSGWSMETTASIAPLRDALIEYLNHPSDQPPQQGSKKEPVEQNAGQAAAALKNREIRTRLRIIDSLQRLGIPNDKWPDFVSTFYTNQQEAAGYYQPISPPPFQPPVFDRLNESPQEWAKAADAAWQQQRDRFLGECQFWVTAGVDEDIPRSKNARGAGRKGRRLNAPPGLRFEWAARRLSGAAWKEIADESFQEARVKVAAGEVLKLANWPSKVKAPNTP